MPRRDDAKSAREARHPIGVVSNRTGLPQDVLRAWERRYGAVTPHRTGTGRRLYSDTDLEKLLLLKLAVDSGRRISDVAPLEIEQLQALAREDAVAPGPGEPLLRGGARRGAESHVREALAEVEKLDGAGLDRVLRQASVDLSPPELRHDVVRPLLEAIGRRWREGSLRIANEHLATAVIRSFLGALRLNGGAGEGAATVIVATPAGQRHELGALLVAIAALEVGWDAVYLGPDLPVVEIATAARQRSARVVALSIVYPASDPRVLDELRQLRSLLGGATAIIVGGASAASYDAVIAEIGARRIDEPHAFQDALDAS